MRNPAPAGYQQRVREFVLSLPDDLVERLEAGEVEEVSAALADAVRHQVRQTAIDDYLAACEAAGHPELTDTDLREFARLVGEEAG